VEEGEKTGERTIGLHSNLFVTLPAAICRALGRRLAVAIPTQTLALMQEWLVAEASTAAWQDYFLFNTGLALVGLIPALPCWRRQKYDPAAAPPPAPRAAMRQGAPGA
jgi:hypothetical protein